MDNLRLHDSDAEEDETSLVDVQHAMGHKDSRMIMRYAHLLPGDLKEAFSAIDKTGTASILSQIWQSEEKIKGVASATPFICWRPERNAQHGRQATVSS